jgi:hypothetical protein
LVTIGSKEDHAKWVLLQLGKLESRTTVAIQRAKDKAAPPDVARAILLAGRIASAAKTVTGQANRTIKAAKWANQETAAQNLVLATRGCMKITDKVAELEALAPQLNLFPEKT